jgi:recombination protein RecA
MKLGAGEVIEDIQVVSTGSLGLDIALGVGGRRAAGGGDLWP